MRDFNYERARDEPGALQSLTEPGTMPIAGGTELLNWMRLGVAAPERVIDVGGLDGMDGIDVTGNWLTLGALTTLNAVGENPLVREHAAVLGQACLKAASAQIRNRATLGGNVLQRTRCAYFRAEEPLPWACNKRAPGSGCAAKGGVSHDAALFGWTDDCVATQPSDPVVALACLDAEIEIAGSSGHRWVPARDFHLTQTEAREAGGNPARMETRLAAGELIRGYRTPIRLGERSAYVKVRERESYAYALVSAAAAVHTEGSKFSHVRIALGSVAQRPWRLAAAEEALVGAAIDADTVRAAVIEAMHDARPLAGNDYKFAMAANAAVRAVMEAAR